MRVRIGPLRDRKLKPGAWRSLTQDEVLALQRAVATQPAPPTTRAERRAAARRDENTSPEG